MHTLILTIHTICSFLLLAVILLQPSKSGGLSGMFGGGGTSFFGGKGAAPFLTKITVVLACVFIVSSAVLTKMSASTRRISAVQKAVEKGEFGGWPTPPQSEIIMDTMEMD